VTVLDASVLIAHLDQDDVHRERAAELIVGLDAGPVPVSVVTLAEVLVGPTRAGIAGQVMGALRDLRIQEVPLGPDAAGRLAAMRVSTRLKSGSARRRPAARPTSRRPPRRRRPGTP
jgi:predicted nucleic acid-binding protein